MIIFVTSMNKILIASFSGFLLAFSWPAVGFFPLVFIAFIPLLKLEQITEKSRHIFWYSFFGFFIFNVITTFWVYHATIFGAVAAVLVNTILMATAFWLFHKVKKHTSRRLGYLSLIFLWISMEYLHLNWDLSWPWLTLGNVFANYPICVQWYEFTGFLGGSLWVLLVNILFFLASQQEDVKQALIFPILIFLFPLIFSIFLYLSFDEKSNKDINVLIVQPNVDPYLDKFTVGYKQQLADFIKLAETGLTQETELLIGPETALTEEIWERQDNRYEKTYSINKLKKLQDKYPNLNILVGALTYKLFSSDEKKTSTARRIRNDDVFYDVYNSAVFISDSGYIDIYHKTKLVPGAEKMPFPKLLDPLAKFAVNLGGVSGSLGSENNNNSFLMDNHIVSPLICYESIYGDMNLGKTNLLAIITNDGWWKNTFGHRQHFQYAKLRAVEQRKYIVRSANTGISAIISSRGDIVRKSNWAEADCLSAKVSLNDKITFYSNFGDYIGRLSVFIALVLMFLAFVSRILKK